MKKKILLSLAAGSLLLPNLLFGFPFKHKINKSMNYEKIKDNWIKKLDFNIDILQKKLNILKEEKTCIASTNNLKELNTCLKNTRKKEKKLRKMLFDKFKKFQLNKYNSYLNLIKLQIEKTKKMNNKKSEKKLEQLERVYKYFSALKAALEKSNSFREFRKNKRQILLMIYGKKRNHIKRINTTKKTEISDKNL